MIMLEWFQLMEKTCIKNMSVEHNFERNETATMFFLKKPSLVSTAQTNLGLRFRNFSLN